ncbi:MAG: hypothetical protein KC800_00230 [Candidatus Eremiobacteraeota bacterium]|nr:hypothetical protein [Candidatus Eremiobacteraeota bacterium]
MLNLWPFKKKTSPPDARSVSPTPPSPYKLYGRYNTLIPEQRLQDFLFTENLIMEFESFDSAPLRDDFLYLSQKFKDNPHPAVLKLIDFGIKNDKLYRAWERRHFHSILYSDRYSGFPKNFLELLDAFRHLSSLGISVWRIHLPEFLSADRNGVFVARLPFTLKTGLALPRCDIYKPPWQHVSQHLFLEPEHLIERGSDFSRANQYMMGALFWALHAEAHPYSAHPAVAVSQGMPIERVHYKFPEPLHEVLYRLTELKPENRYPTFEEGFCELRGALEAVSRADPC